MTDADFYSRTFAFLAEVVSSCTEAKDFEQRGEHVKAAARHLLVLVREFVRDEIRQTVVMTDQQRRKDFEAGKAWIHENSKGVPDDKYFTFEDYINGIANEERREE